MGGVYISCLLLDISVQLIKNSLDSAPKYFRSYHSGVLLFLWYCLFCFYSSAISIYLKGYYIGWAALVRVLVAEYVYYVSAIVDSSFVLLFMFNIDGFEDL